SNGSLACWGDNRFGQLGTGDTTAHTTPTHVPISNVAKIFLPMGSGDITTDLADFSCAITTDNSFSCWGDNRWMQFGVAQGQVLSPTSVAVPPNLSHAAVGAGHICTLDASGGIACFGNDA